MWARIPSDRVDDFIDAVNLPPNLQLLAGTANIEKQDALPGDWIAKAFPTEEKRKTYAAENDLNGFPLHLADFMTFYEERKRRMRDRLVKALGAGPAGDASTD
jgi:hypothetical protein